MGQQSGYLCQAGVEGQQGELSRGDDNIMSKFISDDRSSFPEKYAIRRRDGEVGIFRPYLSTRRRSTNTGWNTSLA
eukprot:3363640-Heterocapsa_arctica.AAC.1